MKRILVLGPGCPKCEKLKKDVETVANELGLEYELEKVTNVSDMMQYGVMTTPALVVDGEVKVVGKAPSLAELKKILG
ncbi:thioredoxin family protein [Oceanidesulfovibrio indonesiensis]|uniref:Thioredoxin family protein n=1 Tax=Oceanidesulfovibrio indonesiensis TaxID=54767 RepID=A0A7M3MHU4_9BACT|nr:thioredoxin family protein [Oceanidesulfovibrio indonesiensis]TVM19262.1 thioredoxin family protein [Oceanidesulfovibrio indonesiensis]